MRDNSVDFKMSGLERVKALNEISSGKDWKSIWKEPAASFPFQWGDCWKVSFDYRVSDFASEVGFFIDVLGFSTKAFGAGYVMVYSPDDAFCIGLTQATETQPATSSEGLKIALMVNAICETSAMLESRGVVFHEKTAPDGDPTSPLYRGAFKTPHGVTVELWGLVKARSKKEPN